MAVKCGACGGNGDCKVCNGKGLVDPPLFSWETKKKTCPRCGGNGVCRGCGGSGWITEK